MKKTTALIVEDEAIIAEDLKYTLETIGITVVGTAATGEAAIKLADDKKPDVVLMDIQLRGAMNGIETAKKIASDSGTPIVFVTAFTPSGMQEAGLPNGSLYVKKPFDKESLQIAINRATGKTT